MVRVRDMERMSAVRPAGEKRPRGRLASIGRRAAAAAALAAAASVVACVVYASITSSPWRLGRYTVRGASYLTPQEVLAAADLQPGDNLFGVNLGKAEEKLSRHPRVRRARIRRRLPAEVVVEVEERPTAAAMIINGVLYKVSDDGVIIEPMATGYEDVPVLVGTRFRAAGVVPGKVVKRGEVRAALATVEALADVDPAWAAAVEYVDVNERVVVLAAGRYKLKYGAALNELEAQRLRRIFDATRNQGGTITYDTRFGTDVIVTGGRSGVGGAAGGGSTDGGAV